MGLIGATRKERFWSWKTAVFIFTRLLQEILENGGIFDFRPAAIIENLGLLNPDGWSYQKTASYGHFGRNEFPWEKTDKATILKSTLQTRQAA